MIPMDLGLAHFISWLYDNTWFELIYQFIDNFDTYKWFPRYLSILFIFLSHAFFKNMVHRLFISVVMEGYRKTHAMSDFIFNEEVINLLIKRWQQYDPEARGYISVSHYFHFLVNLPQPLRLNQEDMLKKLKYDSVRFEGNLKHYRRRCQQKNFHKERGWRC